MPYESGLEQERDYDPSQVLVSVTDCQGVIVSVNDAFCSVSGYRREELIGQPHGLLRHPDMPRVAFEDLWATLRQGQSWRGIIKNRCKNGDYYWADETVEPVYRGGRLWGYRATLTRPSRRQVELAGGLYRHLQAPLH